MVEIRLWLPLVLCLALCQLSTCPAGAQCVDYADYLHPISHIETQGTVVDLIHDGAVWFGLTQSVGLQVFDTTNSTEPLILATLPLPGSFQSLTLVGDFMVIAAGHEGIHVVNISDPTAPTLVGSSSTGLYAFDVAVIGNHAYVAAGSDEFMVLALYPDAPPEIVAQLSTPGFPSSITANDRYIYLADRSSGLRVYDIHPDPEQPTLATLIPITQNIDQVEIDEDRLALSTVDEGVTLYDLSFPSQPIAIQIIEEYFDVQDIGLDGTNLYLVLDREMDIYDISSSALLLASYDLDDHHHAMAIDEQGTVLLTGDHQAVLIDASNLAFVSPIAEFAPEVSVRSMVVMGDVAYLATHDFLQIIDISDPMDIQPLGRLDTISGMYDVAVTGTTVVMGFDGDGLLIADVSNPNEPIEVGALSSIGYCRNLLIADGKVFVLAEGFLSVVDVSDPTEPAILDQYDIYGHDIHVRDGIACVAAHDRVEILDVSDPHSVQPLGQVDAAATVYQVTMRDQWLHFITGRNPGTFHVVDLSNPAEPVVRSTLQVPSYALGYAYDGPYLYAGLYGSPMQCALIHLGDPLEPRLIGEAKMDGSIRTISVRDELLLFAGYLGVKTVPAHCVDSTTEVISPTAPRSSLLKAWPNPFNPRTSVKFTLPAATRVDLDIYDLAGRCVHTLEHGTVLSAGDHQRVWDGRDGQGRSLPSGVYLCRLKAGQEMTSIQLTLIR